MKKLIGLLLTGFLLTLSIMTQAQTSTTDKAYLLNIHNIGTDKAAVRASRDYWERSGDPDNTHWYKIPLGYMAEYYSGPTQVHYVYDKKGGFLYSIRTYTQKEMSADLRHLVRSNYYDFSIGWVKEVEQEGVTAYVVHIEDSVSWKELAVQDGEIRVLHAYCKE